MKQEVLRLDWITKSFGGVPTLKYINFNLFAGEIHVVVGANGVGKSTLLRIITGELQPDSGRIWCGDEAVCFSDCLTAHAHGIFNIANDPEVVEEFDMAGNVAMQLENICGRLLYDEASMRHYTTQLIKDWELEEILVVDRPGYRLSILERQTLHILCAVAKGARTLVIDEPFGVLDTFEGHTLKKLLRRVRERGISVLLVSHNLTDACELADRLTVLRNGCCAATFKNPHEQTELNRLVLSHMAGVSNPSAAIIRGEDIRSEEVFRAEDCHIPGLLAPLRFNVRAGEVLGFISFATARFSICESLFGLTGQCTGSFWMNGLPVSLGTPSNAMEAGIGMMSDNDEYQNLFADLPVYQNVTLPFLKKLFPLQVPKLRVERYVAQRFQEFLLLEEGGFAQSVRYLSKGMQKRLALARWFCIPHQLLMLGEPTKGLDVMGRQQLEQMVAARTREGGSFIIESSSIECLTALCDRILIISRGCVLGTLTAPNITQQTILSAALANFTPGGDFIV